MNQRIDDVSVFADWVTAAARSVDVSDESVDMDQILDLTAVVARRLARPMAPIAAFILGVAAANPGADLDQLRAKIESTLPAPPSE